MQLSISGMVYDWRWSRLEMLYPVEFGFDPLFPRDADFLLAVATFHLMLLIWETMTPDWQKIMLPPPAAPSPKLGAAWASQTNGPANW